MAIISITWYIVPRVMFAVLLPALALLFRFIYQYRKARAQFPGPPVKNFWVGNLDQTMADDVHEKWLHWNRQYGHVFQTWNGPFSRVIYIGNPRMIAKIATQNWPKSSMQYEGFKPLSGDALFIQIDHERWRMQRKSLAPAFQPNIIKGQYDSFAKHLTDYIRYIDTAANAQTTVELSSLHVLLSLDFIGDVAYGTNFHAIRQGSSCRISRLLETVLPELMKCGLFPLRKRFTILSKIRQMYDAIAELKAMAAKAVKNAREGDDDCDKFDDHRGQSHKIFEILAKQREADGSYTFSSKELCDNYVAFVVAGGDPTAHTMSFFVYEVLRNPDILAKLRAEVDASIPFDVAVPSLDQVDLPYLNMVLKETLRFSSTGFGTFRTCPVDTEIEGVVLPANTTLALWNPAVHRDPTLWEDADIFDPERWRPGQAKMKGSYFPFSYGPRNCIGQGLSMLVMTLTLATLFRRYDLSLEPGFNMEYLPSFTLRPKKGLPVRVIRRTS